MRCPQALHFNVLAVGGIFCDGILYFLSQPAQVSLINSGCITGGATVFIGGRSVSGSEVSFFREWTNPDSAAVSSFSGTGRLQDLHFMVVIPGGILPWRRACTWPQ
jgi:hypothetical protein